jgi:hypothetical protein
MTLRKWTVVFEENGDEFTGRMIVTAKSLVLSQDNDFSFLADGVSIKLDERILGVMLPLEGETYNCPQCKQFGKHSDDCTFRVRAVDIRYCVCGLPLKIDGTCSHPVRIPVNINGGK